MNILLFRYALTVAQRYHKYSDDYDARQHTYYRNDNTAHEITACEAVILSTRAFARDFK